MNRINGLLAAVLAALIAAPAMGADAHETRGKVDAVTVYRGQALVTRLVDVPGPAGLRQIVVTGLPAQVVPASLYAESGNGVEVRSVRYRQQAVKQNVDEQVRTLDDKTRQLSDQLEQAKRQLELLGEQKTYLGKLESFVAPTATAELTRGVLNAKALKELTEFQFEERARIAREELELTREQRRVNEELELLRRQRRELTGSSSKTARQAVLFVKLTGAKGGKLRLHYLVNGANWSPSYNLRTGADQKRVTVEYLASIQQQSGESWDDVTMTLSTATPALICTAPPLEQLTLMLAPRAKLAQTTNERINAAMKIHRKTQTLVVDNRLANQFSSKDMTWRSGIASNDGHVNFNASNRQFLEMVNTERIDRRRQAQRRDRDGDISVTYKLAERTSLPSRPDQQLIQIAAHPMQADFYRVAIPLLSEHVYRQAQLVNDSGLVLLSGRMSAYVDGQFVGRGEMPTVAAGQPFNVGFGIDTSLRAARELVEKADATQGGNRLVNLTYRLTIENFSDKPAAVRVLDRLPTGKDEELKVTLVKTSHDLSKDQTYLKRKRDKGMLRWDLEAPAAAGLEALAVEYEYRLEHDKLLAIAGRSGAGGQPALRLEQMLQH